MKNAIAILVLIFITQLCCSQNKDSRIIDPEIKKITQQLIDNLTNYDLKYLDSIYHEDLKFIIIDKEDNVSILTKKNNMDLFTSLKKSGAKPLNNYVEFHYADNDGENGFIITTRKIKLKEIEQEFLFNMHWKKIKNNWKIIRETVIEK